eukprot:COSAG06_NODE_18265_length_895_cov_2.251256_2_plen_30_part_01
MCAVCPEPVVASLIKHIDDLLCAGTRTYHE